MMRFLKSVHTMLNKMLIKAYYTVINYVMFLKCGWFGITEIISKVTFQKSWG